MLEFSWANDCKVVLDSCGICSFERLVHNFTNLPLCSVPSSDISRSVSREYNTSSGQDKHTRKNTHKPLQKLNNYIQEQFSFTVICI